MSSTGRPGQMSLAAYVMVPTAHHHGAWRHPAADLGFLDASWWVELARIYEKGMFDMLFLPDLLAIPDQAGGGYADTLAKGSQGSVQLDPLVTLAAVSAGTRHIGLGITRSATFYPPYDIARSLATLDHLSGGRAAWNIVTTSMRSAALNYGTTLPERDERYDRGDEVVEACVALWDSWAPGALRADKKAGLFADPDAVRRPDYQGRWISARGPLSVPRSPQGRPVLMQAGASDRGRDFAARWGEVLFALQNSLPDMQDFYRDIKRRVREHGRSPEHVKILCGVQVVVAETEEIAEAKRRHLEDLIDPTAGLLTMSYQLGVDMTTFPLDRMLEAIDDVPGTRGSLDVVLQGTKAEGLTLREAAIRYATSELTPQIVGDPDHVADVLEDLFRGEGCDGFIVTPGPLPSSALDFVEMVVPRLQERGLFRTGYPDGTLRDTMGLSAIV